MSPQPQILRYPDKCIGCGKCDDGCYTGARVICGREYTADELMEQILQDKSYYGSDGGVTFSGGEPMRQGKFLSGMIDLCHQADIQCAVETSLMIYDEEIFKKLDLVMADLKIWDDDIHRQYTGVSNRQIKESFKKLNELGVPIIARTPVICEIQQGIDRISAFLQSLDNVRQYELLPYHPLGNSKLEAMGIAPEDFKIPDKKYMEEINKYAYIR
ncbi:MAG: radical SAM protein [Clostridia bacterium]|nr:radical SAM protein [Clostridia bacterium]